MTFIHAVFFPIRSVNFRSYVPFVFFHDNAYISRGSSENVMLSSIVADFQWTLINGRIENPTLEVS